MEQERCEKNVGELILTVSKYLHINSQAIVLLFIFKCTFHQVITADKGRIMTHWKCVALSIQIANPQIAWFNSVFIFSRSLTG